MYLREHADEHLAGLDEFLRHRIGQRRSGAKGRGAARRRSGSRTSSPGIGFENARTDRYPQPPGGHRRLAACRPGQAHRPGLLPLRRPAARSAGRVGPAAVRAAVRGRHPVRARLRRRQGAALHAPHAPPRRGCRASAACRSTCASSSRATRSTSASQSTEFIDAHPELLTARRVHRVRLRHAGRRRHARRSRYGLRGIAYWEVRVQGPFQDVHSGSYGGGVDNPANVLVRMLASLVDDDGRVTVPGFYDDVARPDRCRAGGVCRGRPSTTTRFMKATGVTEPMTGERGWTLVERLSGRPTFDINGIWGGYQGEGSKTIIPGFAARQAEHPAGAGPGSARDRAADDRAPAAHRPVDGAGRA